MRGTTTGGDVAAVSVNGVAATLASDGSFTASNVLLDLGPNTIIVIATDRAGNNGVASVDITRNPDKLGIAITSPADKVITNRHSITVTGQLLGGANGTVTINGTSVTLDPNGAFKLADFALHEGDNVITATVRSTTGGTNSATVTVPADFTPPALKVMAGAIELANDARFAASPTITLQTSDNRPEPITTKLTVDGAVVTAPVSNLVCQWLERTLGRQAPLGDASR